MMQQRGPYRQPSGGQRSIFPKWLTRDSMVAYFAALLVIAFLFSSHTMPWYYWVAGTVSILVFFLYGSSLSKSLSEAKIRKQRNFEKRIFLIAFIPRVLWMFLIYALFMRYYGDAFGFENADAVFYDDLGKDLAYSIREGNFVDTWRRTNTRIDLSDMGYATYVSIVYWLVGNELGIIVVRILKCILSSLMVVLIYRLASRNFGQQVARIAAIFVALWPNFWYYCGAHLKETEMVFLGVLFVEQADQMLRSRQFTAWKIIILLLIASALFSVRTPLALVALLSLIFSVVMSSSRVVSWGKRIVVGGLAVLLVGITMGNQIAEQSRQLFETAQGEEQEKNMEWRSTRENGNAFAKYAGKSVFAPMIFTIPFPTMVEPFKGQDVQQLNHGGNFIKNLLSGFTIFALVILLLSGKWREHLLPLSFMLGYLVVLTMSVFAQSERFHQPVVPFEFLFAAYGLSIAVTKPKYKRWFTYWSFIMFVAAIAWNWFKLAGRGLA